MATVFWGIYAVAFASFATGFGALIEAVNQVGSLFYGGMLGVFVLAFFVKRAEAPRRSGRPGGRGGHLRGGAIHPIAYLWYNMIGCLVVLAVAWGISAATKDKIRGL